MDHYQAVAREVLAVMTAFTTVVEPISIDEAFLDVTGLERVVGGPEAIGRQIKEGIRTAVGLIASVGNGPNRLAAKLASDFGKPDGLVLVRTAEVLDFLAPQPVGVLRGVGPRTLPLLEQLGLRTVADLRRLSLTELQRRLGPRAATSLYQQARGIASDRVGERSPRKSLSKETRFAQDVTDTRVPHDTLLATAWALYQAGRWEGRPLRLIGLGIGARGTPDPVQPDLFEAAATPPADSERARRLAVTLDRIEARFGEGALRRGLKGDDRETDRD